MYTLPHTFSDFPDMPLSLSPLHKGRDGLFAFAVEPVVDLVNPTQTTQCIFCEIDMITGKVSPQSMSFPYGHISSMSLWYVQPEHVWAIAISAYTSKVPLDVYRVSRDADTPWRKVFEANSLD